MPDVINRYAHGFVAVPITLACRRGGARRAGGRSAGMVWPAAGVEPLLNALDQVVHDAEQRRLIGEVRAAYADARRTEIVEDYSDLTVEDLIPEGDESLLAGAADAI